MCDVGSGEGKIEGKENFKFLFFSFGPYFIREHIGNYAENPLNFPTNPSTNEKRFTKEVVVVKEIPEDKEQVPKAKFKCFLSKLSHFSLMLSVRT